MCIAEQRMLKYQGACDDYQKIQQRKRELPKNDRRLFAQLEKVETGRYDVDGSVILMIAKVYGNNAINSFSTIFKLGFQKGQRAEKARRRKSIKGKQKEG